jgi:hypothetical protein
MAAGLFDILWDLEPDQLLTEGDELFSLIGCFHRARALKYCGLFSAAVRSISRPQKVRVINEKRLVTTSHSCSARSDTGTK